MFPVRIMLMYWSAVARFRNNPEHTVDATMLAVFFMKRTNREVMLPSMPLADTHGADDEPDGIHHSCHTSCGNQFCQHVTVSL